MTGNVEEGGIIVEVENGCSLVEVEI